MTWDLASKLIANFIDACQCLVSFIAVTVGGIWTYILFIQKRERFPRVKIDHQVTLKPIDSDKVLFHALVQVENIGEVLVRLKSGEVRLLQVLPLEKDIKENVSKGIDPVKPGDTEIDWYLLFLRNIPISDQPYEIEPGEKEAFHFDFVVTNDIRSVQLYSYFLNEQKRSKEIGWSGITLHDITIQNPGEK